MLILGAEPRLNATAARHATGGIDKNEYADEPSICSDNCWRGEKSQCVAWPELLRSTAAASRHLNSSLCLRPFDTAGLILKGFTPVDGLPWDSGGCALLI